MKSILYFLVLTATSFSSCSKHYEKIEPRGSAYFVGTWLPSEPLSITYYDFNNSMITLYSDGTMEVNQSAAGQEWQEMTWKYESKGEVLHFYLPGKSTYTVIEKKSREFSIRNTTSHRIIKFRRV